MNFPVKNKDFWIELWSYVTSETKDNAILPANLISELYTIGRDIRKYEQDEPNDWVDAEIYVDLCKICSQVSWRLKKRLPEYLHARIVLGTSNEFTKDYIKKYGA